MLAVLRRHLNSWVARLFFFMLIAMFVTWGVGDVIRNVGIEDTSVATVAGHRIELPEAQDAYRRQLQQVTRMLGDKTEPTPEMRRNIANEAVNQLITQIAMNVAVNNMGLAVPEAALRQAVYDMPIFKNDKGVFDRTQFQAILNNNNLTEARFLDLIRSELGQRQLMEAARVGAISPDTLTKAVHAFQQEKRVADMVTLPFSAAPAPAAPTEQQLSRWYENHKTQYSTPEYRRIEAVVLSPETLAKEIEVTDDEIKAAYAQHSADYNKPEKRTVQVLLTPDQERATALATEWSSGADWAAMQKEGANAVELTDATKSEIPAPELGDAAFAAPANTVSTPVHSALGWHVFKVTKIVPGVTRTLAEMRDELRARVVADKAADLIYDHSSKLEDLLAGGTTLETLPDDLGLAAVTGTLDAKGNKMDGTPAPIPGPPSLVKALVAAAFAAKKGDPPTLIEAPHDKDTVESYFSLSVLEITPPAAKPMEEVADAVRADWTRDAIRHEQEEAAAKLLGAVQGGQHLSEAAAGLQVQRLPAIGRAPGAAGVPEQLVQPLFGLKQNEATMVETPDGFIVAELVEIQHADPNADPIGYGQVRDSLAKAIGDDVQSVLTGALRQRASPTVNATQLNSLVQAD